MLAHALQPTCLPPLTRTRTRAAMHTFAHRNLLPGCWGAVDGICTEIRRLGGVLRQKFLNYKHKRPCIVSQAVCDADLVFLDAVSGYKGTTHDARVFRESALGEAIEFRTGPYADVLPGGDERIPNGGTVRPWLAGDNAYPLLERLLTPHRGTLSPSQLVFNRAFCGTRVVIEHAFGVLVARWGIMRVPIMYSPSFASEIIMLCFILHNYCQLHGLTTVHIRVAALKLLRGRAVMFNSRPRKSWKPPRSREAQRRSASIAIDKLTGHAHRLARATAAPHLT